MITAARLLLLFLLFSFSSIAQFNPARSFNLEEENISPSINTIYRNSKGYFLLGTTHGMYRFDGSRFNRIYFQNAEYSDTISAIFEDKNGLTWAGFRNGRIAHLLNGTLTYWNPEEGTPGKTITGFCQTTDGITWFSTNGEGVYYLKDGKTYLVNEDNGLFDLNISSIISSGNDVIAGTDNGIYIIYLRNGKAAVKNISHNDGLPDYIVTSLAKAPNGYWTGFHDNGFCFTAHPSGKVSRPSSINNWQGGEVTSLLFHQGIVWISTRSEGLWRFSTIDSSISRVKMTIAPRKMHYLSADLQGNIWAGGPGSELIRTPGNAITFYTMPEGTMGDHIHALLHDASGKFWTTDQFNNLVRLEYRNGEPVTKLVRIKELSERTDITSIYQDLFGKLWIGTMGKGLFILDTTTLQYRHVTDLSKIEDVSILSITGRGNTIYVSTLQGCFVINAGKNAHVVKTIDFSGLSQGYIYTMMEDSKGRLWIATDGNGISVLDKGTITTYDSRSGLKDERVYSITEDKKGDIWFSTASAGIYRLSKTGLKNYALREGLSNLNISSIRSDSKGNIVSINKKGLDIIDVTSGDLYYFNENYGLQTLNVEDLGANSQGSDGSIYFISGNNITRFYASESTPPKTILDNVLLFLKPLQDSSSKRFSHTENNFTFQYTGLYFSDPDQVFYQYKLEGLDTNWITTRDRHQSFPSLPPGKYTFTVRSSLNRNFDNASEASYSFVIKQAFYKEPWFIILLVISAIGLTYLFFRSREKRMRRIEAMKNEQERVRFALLRNQVNPHFLFNSFNTLITTIEEDPERAVEYTEQLSDFFRNIVTYRDKDVISLAEELNLLKTYFYLQKKRYGHNLHLSLPGNIPENFLIPPLTLQLLMENAIKHNAISRDTPLKVELSINDNYLEVSNNKNQRMSKEKGAGMGLQNIVSRYAMLTGKKVVIKDDEHFFSVSLPQLNADT